MKEGIYLGPRKRRSLVGRVGVLAAVLATLMLAALYTRSHREVERLEAEVASARGAGTRSAPSENDGTRVAALRLGAALSVGAAAATHPSEILRLLDSTLPEEMTLVGLAVGSPPRRSLLIEAVASGAGAVTTLQQNVTASPLVSGTRLLEERRLPDGGLAVRLEVELVEPRLP